MSNQALTPVQLHFVVGIRVTAFAVGGVTAGQHGDAAILLPQARARQAY